VVSRASVVADIMVLRLKFAELFLHAACRRSSILGSTGKI
jgi:hypothetical protein